MKFLVHPFLFFFIATSAVAANTPPKEAELEIRAALVPSGYNAEKKFVGYDNNDPEVLITVVGVLNNTCHRVGPYTVDFKGDEIVIHQKVLEYKTTGKMCIQTKTPFTNHIKLGRIEKANMHYKLVDGASKKVIGELPIEESPVSEPDSDLYLSVSDARLWYDENAKEKKWRVVVVGKYNSTCTKLKKMHVDVLKKERAIVVRPTMERDTSVDDKDCEPTERLQISEPLNVDLTGIWLLHVRSVQGAGKHELVDATSYTSP